MCICGHTSLTYLSLSLSPPLPLLPLPSPSPPQLYSPDPASHLTPSNGGSTEHLEDALSVMANHVDVLDNGGDVMDVPPGEDISERLPSVTGTNDMHNEEAGESESCDQSCDVGIDHMWRCSVA